jgi:hypothetical protein
VSCHTDFITKDSSTPSRSGKYASDLPGVEDLFYELIGKDSETPDDTWERIYRNAWNNSLSDISVKLRQKFFVNYKLLSRETSEFQNEINVSADLAGVKISFNLPRYARLHIVSIKIIASEAYASPEFTVRIYDTDQDGDLLLEKSQEVTEGKNTIFIDSDFEVENLFVSFDPLNYSLRQTENKFYNTGYPVWNKYDCMFPCFGGEGRVTQINGGGLNVIYNVYCSAEKFVCDNLNLFRDVLWWRIGQEMIIERKIGNRLNEATTFTQERGEELMSFYQAQYSQALSNAIDSHNIEEDPICFECKGLTNYKTILP